MKKILSVLLVVAVLMSCFVLSAGAADTTLTAEQISLLKIQRVDADSNGKYETNDALRILSAAMGTIEEDEKYDVDSDGSVSVRDAIVALKAAAGTSPVTNEELVAIVNAKLNGVKTEKPGFKGVSSAQCSSMKITQKVSAEGTMAGLLNAALKEMNYTDLEYDKYVDKMVAQLESNKNNATEEEKKEIDKEIAAMKKSAETYKDAEVAEKTVAAQNASGHKNYFPRSGEKEVSSELTVNDINAITYSVQNGEITFNITMKSYSYTNSTYPKTSGELADLPYGKAFNLPFLREESGSTLNKAEYKNGKITVVLDKDTGDIKSANYSYAYYSDSKAPTQSMTQSGITIKVEMSTKMSATIKEEFTF